MIVGFTGTRRGMTAGQMKALAAFIEESCLSGEKEFHHGACMGADELAAAEAKRLGLRPVIAHPGQPANRGDNVDLSQDACRISDQVLDVKQFHARNRDIVAACEMLIGVPWQSYQPGNGYGGGTWWTIRHAMASGKPVMILWPDGRMELKTAQKEVEGG